MFGLGMPELIVILVLAMLIFGTKRLPELGSGLGKAIRGFRQAADEAERPLRPHAVSASPACPHCGKAAGPEAAFCAGCGKGLSPAA